MVWLRYHVPRAIRNDFLALILECIPCSKKSKMACVTVLVYMISVSSYPLSKHPARSVVATLVPGEPREDRMDATRSAGGLTMAQAHAPQAEGRAVSTERFPGIGRATSGGSSLMLVWRWLSYLMDENKDLKRKSEVCTSMA